jgi:uncharacterized membrane protein
MRLKHRLRYITAVLIFIWILAYQGYKHLYPTNIDNNHNNKSTEQLIKEAYINGEITKEQK